MFYRVIVLCIAGLVLTACGGETATPTETASISPTQPANAEQSVSFVPPSTALTETVTTRFGITYQLPTGWVVDNNVFNSRFSSDADADVDIMGMEVNERWMLIGGVRVFSASDTNDMNGVTSLEQAIPVLEENSAITVNTPIEQETITLPNGQPAYVVIGDSGDWFNAYYITFAGEGEAIIVDFTGGMLGIDGSRDLMTAIVNSISYIKP
jgi:hypothetical protein